LIKLIILDFENFKEINSPSGKDEKKKLVITKHEKEHNFFQKHLITNEIEKIYFSNICNNPSRFRNHLRNEEYDKKEFNNARKLLDNKKLFEINKTKINTNTNNRVFLGAIVKDERIVIYYFIFSYRVFQCHLAKFL
jgi:hypothetical protein